MKLAPRLRLRRFGYYKAAGATSGAWNEMMMPVKPAGLPSTARSPARPIDMAPFAAAFGALDQGAPLVMALGGAVNGLQKEPAPAVIPA